MKCGRLQRESMKADTFKVWRALGLDRYLMPWMRPTMPGADRWWECSRAMPSACPTGLALSLYFERD